MNILITGATGLIGRNLCESLTGDGHRVIGLSRAPEKAGEIAAAELFRWDPQAGLPPAEAFEGVEAIVHLAGESVAARRWTDEQKKRIRDSRIISTRHLVEGLSTSGARLEAFVCASAVGFYGDGGDTPLGEDAPGGRGFLPEVCQEWESEADGAQVFSTRVVKVRTGVVLSAEGGALKKMLPPFKLGVAGRLGSGRQWFPWIHIDDIVGIFRHAIFSSSLAGPVNGVAPGIVTNAEFTRELAGALGRPALLPVPEFALSLLMGEMAEVLTASQRVIADEVQKAGYSFLYPSLAPALANLLGDKSAEGKARQKANSA